MNRDCSILTLLLACSFLAFATPFIQAASVPYTEDFDNEPPGGAAPSEAAPESGIFEEYIDGGPGEGTWDIGFAPGSGKHYNTGGSAGGYTRPITVASTLDLPGLATIGFSLSTTLSIISFSENNAGASLTVGLTALASSADVIGGSRYELVYVANASTTGPIAGSLSLRELGADGLVNVASVQTLGVSLNTIYTMTLSGSYVSGTLQLVGTLSDGSTTIMATGSDATALSGSRFGYVGNLNPNGGNAAYFVGFDNFSASTVPEPSAFLLVALGAAGLAAWRRRVEFLALVCLLTLSRPASADIRDWSNNTAFGNWSTGSNWGGVAPTNQDSAFINKNTAVVSSSPGVYFSLDVGSITGRSGTVTVSGSTLEGDGVSLGSVAGAFGGGNVTGGLWTNNYAYIGYAGSGTLNLTGGTFRVGGGTGQVVLAGDTTGRGVLNFGNGGQAGNLEAGFIHGQHSDATVNFNHTGAVTLGAKLSGSIALNRLGTGSATLSGANTYIGATHISSGGLYVAGTHIVTAGSSGAYTVSGNGTLGGTGTVNLSTRNLGITVSSGGHLAPGSSSGSASDLTFSLGTGVLDVSGAVAGTNSGALLFDLGAASDKISLVTGSLNLGTGTLEFDDFAFNAVSGFTNGSYVLFDTGLALSGTLGSTITGIVGGKRLTLSLSPNGHDLLAVVTSVPEPTAFLLLSLGGGGLLARRRRAGLGLSLAPFRWPASRCAWISG